MKKTPLFRQTPLKSRTPLKRTKSLNKVSSKQAKENALWSKIKKERIDLLKEKYGAIPCEYCNFGIYLYDIDAHHNDRNRRNNTLANARILHRLCHTFVTDNNVKDVPNLLKNNFQNPIDNGKLLW